MTVVLERLPVRQTDVSPHCHWHHWQKLAHLVHAPRSALLVDNAVVLVGAIPKDECTVRGNSGKHSDTLTEGSFQVRGSTVQSTCRWFVHASADARTEHGQ